VLQAKHLKALIRLISPRNPVLPLLKRHHIGLGTDTVEDLSNLTATWKITRKGSGATATGSNNAGIKAGKYQVSNAVLFIPVLHPPVKSALR
jgi:hypothetical protein